MDAAEFRTHGHQLVDWIAEYLEHADRYPVLSRNAPGDIVRALPTHAPDEPESFGDIFADFERLLVPGLTHWNHPGFMAYFAITASGPGILGEFLSAALNQQAMLWRTSPVSTELEQVTLNWLRQLIGLPEGFDGVIYDTASISTMHALTAAREVTVPGVRSAGLAGRPLPRYRIYCSDQAHSSVDKAVIAIGLGHDALTRVASDGDFRMDVTALAAAIAADRANGIVPMAVVATIGTTSTTSVDPLRAIATICQREGVWLHVDAAYAGVAAMLPTHRHILDGVDLADSLVVNPHKWLFTPFDVSTFFCRRMDVVRAAFSLTPDYLKTAEAEAGAVQNLMDTGVQLGRRFRSLKLWMVMRSFGARGLGDEIARHIDLAQQLAGWIDGHPDFVRVAPTPFSVVCFRWEPADRPVLPDGDGGRPHETLDTLNERLLEAVNASGEVFISQTRLNGRYVIRVAIGHEKTTIAHVRRVWDLLQEHAARLSLKPDRTSL